MAAAARIEFASSEVRGLAIVLIFFASVIRLVELSTGGSGGAGGGSGGAIGMLDKGKGGAGGIEDVTGVRSVFAANGGGGICEIEPKGKAASPDTSLFKVPTDSEASDSAGGPNNALEGPRFRWGGSNIACGSNFYKIQNEF